MEINAILEQVKPETAELIAAQARAHGLSVDEYLRHLLEMGSPAPAPEADLDEFTAAMDSLAEDAVPPLPRDFSREDIYFSRDCALSHRHQRFPSSSSAVGHIVNE